MSGIGVISNLYAKVNKNDPQHNTLVWYILGNRGQLEVTHTLDDLTEVCQEFKQQNLSHVGIIGGDGTVSLALSSLQQAYSGGVLPKICLFRGGTFNVLASNLGIYGKPKDILSDFLESFHSQMPLKETKVTTLQVNGRLGFLFANGLGCNYLAEFYKNKKSMVNGVIFTTKIFFQGLKTSKTDNLFQTITAPQKMKIHCNPFSMGSTDGLYSAVFASTIPRLPYGFPFFRDINLGSDMGQIIALRLSGKELLAAAAATAAHIEIPQKFRQSVNFNQCTIEVESDSLYSLDGDIMSAPDGKISISMGPTFTFCSPYGNRSL